MMLRSNPDPPQYIEGNPVFALLMLALAYLLGMLAR